MNAWPITRCSLPSVTANLRGNSYKWNVPYNLLESSYRLSIEDGSSIEFGPSFEPIGALKLSSPTRTGGNGRVETQGDTSTSTISSTSTTSSRDSTISSKLSSTMSRSSSSLVASLTVSSTVSSNSSTFAGSGPSKPPNGNDSGLSTSSKVAIGVVVPFVLFVAATLGFFWVRRRKVQKQETEYNSTTPELDGTPKGSPDIADYLAKSRHEIDGEGVMSEANAVVAPLMSDKRDSVLTSSEAYVSASLVRPPRLELFNLNCQDAAGIGSVRDNDLALNGVSFLLDSDMSISQAAISIVSPQPGSPLPRKEVPRGVAEQSSVAPQDIRTWAEKEEERIELENRKRKIVAEREHLRRMRMLEEEEATIDYRLKEL